MLTLPILALKANSLRQSKFSHNLQTIFLGMLVDKQHRVHGDADNASHMIQVLGCSWCRWGRQVHLQVPDARDVGVPWWRICQLNLQTSRHKRPHQHTKQVGGSGLIERPNCDLFEDTPSVRKRRLVGPSDDEVAVSA